LPRKAALAVVTVVPHASLIVQVVFVVMLVSILVMVSTASSMIIVVTMVVAATVMVLMTAMVAATPTVMMVIIVRSVDLEPVELMLLVLKEERLVALLICHLRQDGYDLYQAEGIKGCIVLLAVTQRPSLPVGHLLALAHLQIQQVLGDLG